MFAPARTTFCWLAVSCLFICAAHPIDAGVIFDIGSHKSGAYSASSFHSANTNSTNNVTNGRVTDNLFGTLEGDMNSFSSGSVLGVTGGSVVGNLGGNIASFFGNSVSDSHLFRAQWTGGQLKFYEGSMQSGLAEGLFGGWLDYQLQYSSDGGTNFVDISISQGFAKEGAGTLFFAKEDHGYDNVRPSPNTWVGPDVKSISSFALWGNNWQTTPTSNRWDFLSGGVGNEGLSYSGPNISKDDLRNGNVFELGSDLYGESSTGITSNAPEPGSMAIWGLFGLAGIFRRRMP